MVDVLNPAMISAGQSHMLIIVPQADACPADVEPINTGNGLVDVDDLLAVINSWGDCDECKACTADVDGNCVVEVADLLSVINGWGVCD